MADEPIFYKRNWIDSLATITPDSGSSIVSRIYDQDNSLQWSSNGDNSDAVNSTIEVDFLDEGGVAATRAIDTIIFTNWNVKSGKVQQWNGSAFADIGGAATFSAQAATYLVISGLSVSTSKLNFIFSTTQSGNQEKVVGEIWALSTLWAPPTGIAFSKMDFAPVHSGRVAAPMLDLGLAFAYIRWAGARTRRYAGRFGFDYLTLAQLNSLLTILDTGIFTVYPEPVQNPDQLFLCTHMGGQPAYSYNETYKGGGYHFELDLLEVGA